MQSMNLISFCLFGSDPCYLTGAIKNAKLAEEIYPGWDCIFFVDNELPQPVYAELAQLALVKVVSNPLILNKVFWRYLANDLTGVSRVLYRDCDSRLNLREKAAVDAWIESNRSAHIMCDHPGHVSPVGGAMWGCKTGVIENMSELIEKTHRSKMDFYDNGYAQDECFLAETILPLLTPSLLRHHSFRAGEFPEAMRFPPGSELVDGAFVGEKFNEHDVPHREHREARSRALATE